MRIDLFELIEGFFSGVIYFLYNAVATTIELIRQPYKGPLRLYLRHRSKRRRQMGGLTYMFLLYFILMLALGLFDFTGPGLSEASRAILVSADFDAGGIFWPVTMAALIATTITDAALRLLLRARLRARPLRAEATLNATELAFLWPLVGIVGVWGSLVLVVAHDDPFSADIRGWGPAGIVVGALAGVAFLLTSPLPPLAVLRSGLRRAGRRRRRGLAGWPALAAGMVMIWFLTVAAVCIGTFPLIVRMHDQLTQQGAEFNRHHVVEVVELHCHLAGPRPYADALLLNRSSRPLLLHLDDVRVRSHRWRNGSNTRINFVAPDDGAEPILLQPGTAIAVRLRLNPNLAYARSEPESCSISALSRRGEAQLFGGRVVHQQNRVDAPR